MADLTLATEELRAKARDLYLATLLVPESIRPLATCLFAYHVELSGIVRQVSEPMAGAIRLQWWADVMAGERAGEAQGHPLARTILELLDLHDLSPKPLAEKALAHEFDLFAEPMETRAMFEGYCGETRSVLFQMLAMAAQSDPVLDQSDLATAAGHAGVSTGIVAIVTDLERQRQQRQIFVPQDLLKASGLSDEDYCSATIAELRQTLDAFLDLGWEHHEKTSAAIADFSPDLKRIFSLCALTPAYLKNAEKAYSNGHLEISKLSQLRSQWLLYRAKI